MTLYEKSQAILELPAVLELLAAEAVSDGAKEAARLLTPSSDKAEVEKRLRETTDARELMTLHSAPSFSGVKDIRGREGRREHRISLLLPPRQQVSGGEDHKLHHRRGGAGGLRLRGACGHPPGHARGGE